MSLLSALLHTYLKSFYLEIDASVQHVPCGNSIGLQTNEIPELQAKIMTTNSTQTLSDTSITLIFMELCRLVPLLILILIRDLGTINHDFSIPTYFNSVEIISEH